MDEPGAGRPGRRDPLGRAGRPPRPGIWGVTRSIVVLEHAQDVVTVVVGLVLVILAAIILASGIASFFHSVSATRILSAQSVIDAATGLLDEILLVLILIEIVHTVVLSLHSHRLVPQPFIVVGLVAVIRKILFVLSGQTKVSTSVLAVLLAMVTVFVLSLILVNRFEKSAEPDSAGR